MNRASLVVLCAAGALWSTRALADDAPPDKAACLDASSQAQNLRDTHKLIEAREKLRICAQQVCPGIVQKDCLAWLDQVEQSVPTVVISAKDGTGKDLFDVKVTADGQPLTTKLQGDAIPLTPGVRALHFEIADGTSVDQQVLVKEGVKNQSIAVVIGKATPAPGTAAPGAAPGAGGPVDVPPDSGGQGGGIPWRTVGWISGGVGVVGVGLGAVFGFMAMSDKSSAHCDSSNACDSGPLSSANSAATVSTVGFVVGGVFLAGGAALILFGPKGESAAAGPAPAATLKLAPLVGARDAGLQLGGSW